jgi:group I intron endonuclease
MDHTSIDSGVYKITNLKNWKVYVGSSSKSGVRKRMKQHKDSLNKGYHENSHLQRAWNKYGVENFEFSVLELCPPKACVGLEQDWINEFHASDPKFGYNKMEVAKSVLGFTHSEDSKKKISKGNKGKKKGPMTKEQKEKLSEAMTGRKRGPPTEETKMKMSKAKLGKKYGPRTDEIKKKISTTLKGRKRKPFTEDWKAKLAKAATGRWHTEETKKKISTSKTGKKRKPFTEEHKKNLSLAGKRRYQFRTLS